MFSHSISRNRLLATLAPEDLALLAHELTEHPLAQGAILQQAEAPVEQVYFPQSGMISLVSTMRTGETVETAAVGRNGVVGAFAGLGPWNAFTHAVVQVPGTAACISLRRSRVSNGARALWATPNGMEFRSRRSWTRRA